MPNRTADQPEVADVPEAPAGPCPSQVNYYRDVSGEEEHIGTGPGCTRDAGHKGDHDPDDEVHPQKIARWE